LPIMELEAMEATLTLAAMEAMLAATEAMLAATEAISEAMQATVSTSPLDTPAVLLALSTDLLRQIMPAADMEVAQILQVREWAADIEVQQLGMDLTLSDIHAAADMVLGMQIIKADGTV